MRRFLCLTLIALGGCSSAEKAPEAPDMTAAQAHARCDLGYMAQQSYETGCLHSAQRICARLNLKLDENACREDALVECERGAKRFRDYVNSGASGAAPLVPRSQ